MYIYHALINALSTHIHINLNMIFYTIYIKYYTEKQTHALHTDNDCSRNWVLILVGINCEKRKVFSLALKDERIEQSKVLWE